MRILGIDPGYAIVGFGVIDSVGIKYKPVSGGVITTPAGIPIEDRLLMIYEKLTALVKKYKPEAAAVEELFFNTNHTTGIPVAEARGVILLCLKQNGIPVYEYTPLQVKQAVVGYGRAEKQQVIAMTTSLLSLSAPPKPDDAADALAIAICHANIGGSGLAQFYNKR
ncbi:MAG: crossover junction endodeoxyribonuclease RuvC [Clostridia bacterium]|nr:crossover junction endodeoxyribonuclease RuvC [Clostridia bacterium]